MVRFEAIWTLRTATRSCRGPGNMHIISIRRVSSHAATLRRWPIRTSVENLYFCRPKLFCCMLMYARPRPLPRLCPWNRYRPIFCPFTVANSWLRPWPKHSCQKVVGWSWSNRYADWRNGSDVMVFIIMCRCFSFSLFNLPTSGQVVPIYVGH